MSELQRIKDEGSEEEDEPRIDMSKLDEEEDGERDRSWIHYNRHVLREYGPRVDTLRSLWYHNVSRRSKACFNWRRSRYNHLKKREAKAAQAKGNEEDDGVWNDDDMNDFVQRNCTFDGLLKFRGEEIARCKNILDQKGMPMLFAPSMIALFCCQLWESHK